MNTDFVEAIKKHQSDFRLNLDDANISALDDYYRLVMEHNDLLHLVAPCSPEEFAVRHILESLTLLEFLPAKARLADVGTGAGLPSIPCLLVRADLEGILIEASQKKSSYLQEIIPRLGLESRTQIISRQFEEIRKPNANVVTSRALDKFTKKLPALVKWSGDSRLALFGGNNLRDELRRLPLKFRETLTPHSEQRFLFTV